MKEDTLEKIFIKALDFLEEGKSPSEILRLFPEHQKEVREFLATINLLEAAKSEITPSREGLARLLKRLGPPTPAPKLPRFAPRRLTILVPLGAFAILLALFILGASAPGEPPAITQELAADSFDLAAIQAEASALDFDDELYNFLSEEAALEEIDAALRNL